MLKSVKGILAGFLFSGEKMIKTNLIRLQNKFILFQKKSIRLIFLIILSLTITQTVQAITTMKEDTLHCELKVSSPQNLIDGVFVTFSIINKSSDNIKLLTWYTPFEGFMSDLFVISDAADQNMLYQGAMVKRSSPQLEDFIAIASKEKKQFRLDLSTGYKLEKGRYKLQLKKTNLQYKLGNSSVINFSCMQPEIHFTVN